MTAASKGTATARTEKLMEAAGEKLSDAAARHLASLVESQKKGMPAVLTPALQEAVTADRPTAGGHIKGFRAIGRQLRKDDKFFRSCNVDPGAARDALKGLDLHLLEQALQGAVTLEFATLPPYLSALWSVKDELHPVAKSIREIVQEEMLHMALVCNILSAIGVTPKINTAVPAYPGKLPLGVHPELTVPLSGLSDEILDVFLEIERPINPAEHIELAGTAVGKDAEGHGESDKTIGQFYDEIIDAFKRIAPALSVDRQVTGPLAWRVVRNIKEVASAIDLIKRQGEGADSPFASDLKDLPHYFRFAEIRERKELYYNPKTGRFTFDATKPVKFPKVWPVAVIPEGGYQREDVSSEVWHLLEGFDRTYSRLLDLLQSVWEKDGGQASFWHAIETMFELQKFAKPLMETPIPGRKGKVTYGPCFRYIPKNQR